MGALELSTAWQFALAIVLMDFCAYWVHRIQHRSEDSFLWRVHAVHHAVPTLDVSSGAQAHLFDSMVTAFPLLVLAVLGFEPEAIGAAFAINLATAGLHHAKLPTELGWFNYITIGPEPHRWHHGDPDGRTVNVGFVFALWDLLFGTFYLRPGQDPKSYGARSIEVFPDSVYGQMLVGTTARHYNRLVKREPSP
jgi:sterol desaturase/sphingolipid hydroxylase (fatty acid hydroxylase superfamily)